MRLFFLVSGDFYEMFKRMPRGRETSLDSADLASKSSPIRPLVRGSVSAALRISTNFSAQRTVALCEQVEDPKLAKGLVVARFVRL